MQSLTELFMNIIGCCNFTPAFFLQVWFGFRDNNLLSSKTVHTSWLKKRSIWPLSTLKTVHLGYCSSLSVARLVRFWFKNLQSLTDHKSSSYKVTYSFWLCVHTRCLTVCAPSFVAVIWCNWALWIIAFGVWNTPQTVEILAMAFDVQQRQSSRSICVISKQSAICY